MDSVEFGELLSMINRRYMLNKVIVNFGSNSLWMFCLETESLVVLVIFVHCFAIIQSIGVRLIIVDIVWGCRYVWMF